MIPDTKIEQAKTADIMAIIPVDLRRVSGHGGGEFAGSCPFCGGDDRFRVWPSSGRWWCRQCKSKGDPVDLVMELEGITFAEAVAKLAGGVINGPMGAKRQPTKPEPEQDFTAWQSRAREFHHWALDQLGKDALRYLATRGLDDITAYGAGLGWNPRLITDRGEHWGLTGRVTLSPGLVIPYEYEGQITAFNIRTSSGYRIVRGSRLAIDGQRVIFKPSPWDITGQVILFEGEIDALSAWQALADPTIGVGSIPAGNLTSLDQIGGRDCWVCFDTDKAGKDAAAKAADLGAKVINLPEKYKDFNAFYVAVGQDQARHFLTTEMTQ